MYGVRVYHRFLCASVRLPYLYRVRATRATIVDGDWHYRLVVEEVIPD